MTAHWFWLFFRPLRPKGIVLSTKHVTVIIAIVIGIAGFLIGVGVNTWLSLNH
jgi:hypothetical protein